MKRTILIITIILSCVASTLNAAQKPKLVVQIVVSQMRYDYLKRFERNFSHRGFNTIINNGVSCTNARYNYSNTTSAAGLSTIVSGANPSYHGILSQSWMDYTTNNEVEVVDNKSYYGVGCLETDGQFAPTNLTVSTLADEIKRDNASSRVVSLALTPSSAILGGGLSADAAYWFDIYRGNWATSTYYTNRLPSWVDSYNNERFADGYKARTWNAFIPQTSYIYTNGKDIDTLKKASIIFSLSNIFNRTKNNDYTYSTLRNTPMGTDMLFEMAKKTIIYESMGKDDAPDLLVVTVDPTRVISESYGTESMELEDTYYRLDANIESLIDYINIQIGRENVLLVITSDHGSSDTFSSSSRMPSGVFNVVQFKVLMNGFLNALYGTENWVTAFNNRCLYLNRKVAFEKKINIADMQNNAAAFAMQFRGVAQAVTANSLQGNHFSGGALEKIQNGFYAKNSGDIVINLLPGWIEDMGDRLSASGSIYEYDTHVPLLWYGCDLKRDVIDEDIDMTDIAPTISNIVGVNRPNAATGRGIPQLTSKFDK